MVDTNGIHPYYPLDTLPDHRLINMVIAQPTKPSNYFHILRRQMLRQYRKPLVVITPKIGLKHAAYVSKFEDLGQDSKFQPIVIDNYSADISKTKSVIFCSGQIFIEINKAIKESTTKSDVTVMRIEEIAPFPERHIMDFFKGKNINKSMNVTF
jgi:2-oxoglutarate dehydrogenase complex dehydrogenase (E1) component-like enzyme